MYSSCPIQTQYVDSDPCFLLPSPRLDFPLPVDVPLIFIFISQCTLALSLHLVFLAPFNSCSSIIYYIIVYLVLSYFLWCLSSGLSTDVFSYYKFKTNICIYS